ncbi:hypothetical protein IC582_018427 [Cucumis melo]|uniref:Late embryogenesis abundant protein n=1 Tax=Cucumis melo var. makuwa TaxID=1194695 RepID=A0A5D3CN97_CUCMM|nr:late embryogenesis abundant protein [Cucumis melo var. makuwa]TYK12628.1 late embryogenesis abundant protein [Cucumis melo var. makuwa]
MINAIRFGRTPPPIVLTSPLPPQLRRSICSLELRSRQATGFATAPDQNPKDEEMDESQNKTKETGDIMCDSFGEGYATRSEEEGFGGTYGGNVLDDDDEEHRNKKSVNEHEYDRSQGSEVKEKEKSRHQAHAN